MNYLKDYQYIAAKRTNDYLKAETQEIREQMLEIITEGICPNCSEVKAGVCHCTNDD